MRTMLACLAVLLWGMELISSALAAENSNSTTIVTQPVDYILTGCQEMPGKSEPTSAERFIDPAGFVSGYYYEHFKREPDPTSALITLLKKPTHGKIVLVTDNVGWPEYRYDAVPDYSGRDQVTFMATYHGDTYKVIVNLLVSPVETIPDNGAGMCPEPELIKVKNKQAH